jgi:hypothetical protein
VTLEDLGNLGDFLGGIAVIVTLIYLAVQIRQNTKLLRKSAEQMIRSDSTAVVSLAAQSPENAALYHRGLGDPDGLSPEERTHFYLLMAVNFYHFQQGYSSHQSGMQSDDTWKSQLQALQFYASRPGVRAWWRHQGNRLIAQETDFWRLVDSEVRKNEESSARQEVAAEVAEPGTARP